MHCLIVSDIFLSNCVFQLLWPMVIVFAGPAERDMWSLLADGLGTEQPGSDNAESYH